MEGGRERVGSIAYMKVGPSSGLYGFSGRLLLYSGHVYFVRLNAPQNEVSIASQSEQHSCENDVLSSPVGSQASATSTLF